MIQSKSQCCHIGPSESPLFSPEMLFLKITGFVNYSEIVSRLQCVWLAGNNEQEGSKLEKNKTLCSIKPKMSCFKQHAISAAISVNYFVMNLS